MTTWNNAINRFSKFSDNYGSAKSAASTVKGLVSGSKKSKAATDTSSSTGTVGTQTQGSSTSSDSKKKLATSNNAIHLDFKLYIEGEECPFESASISFGVSTIPTMTLQLVPYKILRNLGERTKVHFYFIDPVDGEERLLFDGEISGVGYTKNPTAQTLTYSVMHVSNYLSEILVSFFDISAFAVTFPPLYTKTFGAELEADYSSYHTTTLEKVLVPARLGSLNTFQEIFVELFEEIFKVGSGEEELNVTLKYFKEKVDEWKLDKRLATLPASTGEVDAAVKFVDFIKSEDDILRLRNEVKKIDGWQSMFTVLGEMFSAILYYPTILPSPYLYESEQLQTILYKPQALFVLPPICNVIWPSMYTVFSYSRNFKNIPTRLFVRAGINRQLQSQQSKETDSAITELAAQYFWAPAPLQYEIDSAADAIAKYKADEAAGKIVDRYGWYNPTLKEAGKESKAFNLKAKTALHKTLLNISSDREREVGVRTTRPADNQFFTNFAEWLIQSAKSKEEYKNQIARLLDYELARQQFETEAVSMVMVFNPYIVPGFPALIMDKPESGMHVYGYISGGVHTISAAAGCSTTIDIGYIHQYDEKVSKRFIVAEDVWADEDTVYEGLLGVKSIKSAEFNTLEDEKKKDDPSEIAENIAENMLKDDFHDYIYNAYSRSGRKIITKTEYDKFVKDVKYDEKIQKKVKQYRKWVEKRVAGSEALEESEDTSDSSGTSGSSSASASGSSATSSDTTASSGSTSDSAASTETTVATKTAEKKSAAQIWEDSGGGISAEDKAKDAAFYASRERARNRPKFGL
jgi:hypothetical protein